MMTKRLNEVTKTMAQEPKDMPYSPKMKENEPKAQKYETFRKTIIAKDRNKLSNNDSYLSENFIQKHLMKTQTFSN